VGSFCPAGTVSPLNCTSGAFCAAAASEPEGCPAGTFLNKRGATAGTECETCPAYHYCPEYTTYPVKCPPGYFCSAGQGAYAQNPCTAGTYGGLDSLTSASECTTCPQGHYCPEASVFPTACGPGTYQASTGQSSVSACTNCPATTVCPFYGLRHSATEIYCSPGHACPAGTKWRYENPCPAGTYSDAINITATSSCITCPGKYACPRRPDAEVGSLGTNTLTNPRIACAAGHYCPAGTTSATERPCPAGTYSPATDNYQESQCISCPPGQYCTGGRAAPDGDCSAGHYCPMKASAAT